MGLMVVFTVQRLRIALPIDAVDRVVRMVDINALPRAPGVVYGVIDVAGLLTPVINLYRCFGLPCPEPRLSDILLLVRNVHRPLAIWAEEILGVEPINEASFSPLNGLLAEAAQFMGVAKREDGLVLIQNIDALLSAEDEAILHDALNHENG